MGNDLFQGNGVVFRVDVVKYANIAERRLLVSLRGSSMGRRVGEPHRISLLEIREIRELLKMKVSAGENTQNSGN